MNPRLFKELLEKIHSRHWETSGTIVGFLGCLAVISQIIFELKNSAKTSMSVTYLFSFLIIYSFWFLYGIRFNRIAIWLTNFFATVLQIALIIICLLQ